MLRYGLIIFLSAFLLGGCTQSGPCEYDQIPFKAKVIEIKPFEKNGKQLFHVGMSFNNSSLYDKTQYLDELKNIEIDSVFIKRNKIQKGFVYTGIVSERRGKGDCTDLFVSFDQHLR